MRLFVGTNLLLIAALISHRASLGAELTSQPASLPITATPWPEADKLFHREPDWLGSDDAYSIDLGGGRVLWLFGDSFVATSKARVRRESKMVRNSIAVQQGYDPSTASIRFYWKSAEQKPSSFFPEEGETWFWPVHGAVVNGRLLLMLMQVERSTKGLGFRVTGTRPVEIANFADDPDRWTVKTLPGPENMYGLILSGGMTIHDRFLYGLATDNGPPHAAHLVRWPLADAGQAKLAHPEWWVSAGWIDGKDSNAQPAPIFAPGQNEMTVHWSPERREFLAFQTSGFFGAKLAVRHSAAITGPWSPLQEFYTPDESKRTGQQVYVYAGKAHPELKGADVVLTYASNSTSLKELVDDTSLSYPRFVRVTFAKAN